MSGYGHTYPDDCSAGSDNLTPDQRELYIEVRREAAHTGQNCAGILARAHAGNADKAAVADALGGPGAGNPYR